MEGDGRKIGGAVNTSLEVAYFHLKMQWSKYTLAQQEKTHS